MTNFRRGSECSAHKAPLPVSGSQTQASKDTNFFPKCQHGILQSYPGAKPQGLEVYKVAELGVNPPVQQGKCTTRIEYSYHQREGVEGHQDV